MVQDQKGLLMLGLKSTSKGLLHFSQILSQFLLVAYLAILVTQFAVLKTEIHLKIFFFGQISKWPFYHQPKWMIFTLYS